MGQVLLSSMFRPFLILDFGLRETDILATRSIRLGSSTRSQIAGKAVRDPLQDTWSDEDMLGSFVRRVARLRNRSASLKLFCRTVARRAADRGCTFQFSTFKGTASRCL